MKRCIYNLSRYKKCLLKVMMLFLGLFTFACTPSAPPINQDEVIFTYFDDLPATIDQFNLQNQAEKTAARNIFTTLFEIGEDMQVYPVLIEKESVDETALKWEFEIKKNVFFHDNECFISKEGREVLAKDVVYSLKRLVKTPKGTLFAQYLLQNGDSIHIDAIKVLGTHRFLLQLQKKFTPLKQVLAQIEGAIVPFEAVEYWGADFKTHPVSCGAFFLEKLTSEELILKKNEKYFRIDGQRIALPYTKNIILRKIPSKTICSDLMMNKSLDIYLSETNLVKDSFWIDFKTEKVPLFDMIYFVSAADSILDLTKEEKNLLYTRLKRASFPNFQSSKRLFPENMPTFSLSSKRDTSLSIFPAQIGKQNLILPKDLEKLGAALDSQFREHKILLEIHYNENKTQEELYQNGVLKAGLIKMSSDFGNEYDFMAQILANKYLAKNDSLTFWFATSLELSESFAADYFKKIENYLMSERKVMPIAQGIAVMRFSKTIQGISLHPHGYLNFEHVKKRITAQ